MNCNTKTGVKEILEDVKKIKTNHKQNHWNYQQDVNYDHQLIYTGWRTGTNWAFKEYLIPWTLQPVHDQELSKNVMGIQHTDYKN